MDELHAFARTLQWVDYDRTMWVDAASLWADQRRRGRTHDADLLIAAFTRRLGATPLTTNTADFADLELPIGDWMVDRQGS